MEFIYTSDFESWIQDLRDKQARKCIMYRLNRCQTAGRIVGDTHPVGGGVSELRFDFGPGYRVYFAQKESTLILLLAGGEKHGQNRDIRRARVLLQEMKEDGQW
jgi:putative addiction module killer protein